MSSTSETHLSGARTLADDVLDGLTRPFKELPPKHLYDARGSELFDRITEQPEYYPTRCERWILEHEGAAILATAGAGELVELGSGSAEKAQLLLATGRVERYVPFEVSESALEAAAAALAVEHPGVAVHAVAGDFERHLDRLPDAGERGRVIALLGGTIGNFTPGARRRWLRGLAERLGPRDSLLVGVDLVKDIEVMEAAYDDAAGVTAAFEKNVLAVVNRELDADFDPDRFEYVAFFDPDREWIDMRLRADRAHTVTIGALDLAVAFARGEELRTEISTKFTRERVQQDWTAAGLEPVGWWTDPKGWFALTLARAVPS